MSFVAESLLNRKKVPMVLVALFVTLLGIVAFQPAEFRVSRSVTINASPAEVFPHLGDLRRARAWMPWVAAPAPLMVRVNKDGDSISWDGMGMIQGGHARITGRRAAESVQWRVTFKRPREHLRSAEWICFADLTLKPIGRQTQVTWTLWGEKDFEAKVAFLFTNQDWVVGSCLEHALAKLQQIAEAPAEKQTAASL